MLCLLIYLLGSLKVHIDSPNLLYSLFQDWIKVKHRQKLQYVTIYFFLQKNAFFSGEAPVIDASLVGSRGEKLQMTKICRFILAQTHPEGKDDVDVSAEYHCKFMIVACLYNSQLQYDRCLKSRNMKIKK